MRVGNFIYGFIRPTTVECFFDIMTDFNEIKIITNMNLDLTVFNSNDTYLF